MVLGDRPRQPRRVGPQPPGHFRAGPAVRLDYAALLRGQQIGFLKNVGRHAQHSRIVDQGGQHRLDQSAVPVRVVPGDAGNDAGRGKAVAGGEVGGPGGVAFAEQQRPAVQRIGDDLLGQVHQRRHIHRPARLQFGQQVDQNGDAAVLRAARLDAGDQRLEPAGDHGQDRLQPLT